MPKVTFREYILPYGRQEDTEIEVSQEAFDKAATINALNLYRFEMEVLTTSVTSLTIVDLDEEIDAAIQLALPDAADANRTAAANKLIMDFDHATWCKEKQYPEEGGGED